jgi:glucokinase
MKALAIDLGGTHANCAIVEDRNVRFSQLVRTNGDGTLREVLPRLVDTLVRLAAEANLPLDAFAGLALGFCGLVDRHNIRVTATNAKYEDATDIDLPRWAERELGLPLFLENDARMALLGERYAGSGIGSNDIVMVTLGTGIGGAVMMDGRLLIGKHFQAGCLGGHIAARFDGHTCTCGASGCAESEASGWALPRICRDWPGFENSMLQAVDLNFENVFHAADQGDSVAADVCQHCLNVWAVNAVSLVHAYDPELLIFGGGVMRRGDAIVRYIQNYVTQNAWTPWGTVEVRAAALGNNAPLLGAIPLIAQMNGAN